MVVFAARMARVIEEMQERAESKHFWKCDDRRLAQSSEEPAAAAALVRRHRTMMILFGGQLKEPLPQAKSTYPYHQRLGVEVAVLWVVVPVAIHVS